MQHTILTDLLVRVVLLGLEHDWHRWVGSASTATGLSHLLGTPLRRVHWNRCTTGESRITRIREWPGKGTGREIAESPQRWRRRVGCGTAVELRCAHTHGDSRILTRITRMPVKTWQPWMPVKTRQPRCARWCTRRLHLAWSTSSVSGRTRRASERERRTSGRESRASGRRLRH